MAAPAPAARHASLKPTPQRWLGEFTNALFGRKFPTWDALMVILAGVDVLALLLRRELDLPAPWETYVLWFDWAVLAVFALEFLASLARADQRGRFARANWYDLVGLIPLPIAFLRAFRLLRVPHVLFWGSRFPAEAEREYGGAFAVSLLRRYEPVIVEDLTDPLLVRVLQVLREALAKGRYATAFGEGLEARRHRLRGIVAKSIRERPVLGLLMAAPGMEDAVRAVEDQMVDVLVSTLTDPELDAVIKESMDDALAGLQTRIAQKDRGAGA